MKEIVIGPSNGWLYAKDIFSLRKHREFLKKAGANAIEFCGTEDDRRKESLLSDEEIGELRHVSLHLPDYKSSKSINDQVSSIRKIVRRRKPRHCLIHPLKIPSDYWEALANRNIPVVIENMDKREFSGYDLKELEGLLKDFELGFVLDVQHAFEHDPSMNYALDLFKMAGNKLVYLHVSGETENNNHALVHQSRNCEAIVNFLGTIFFEIQLPIILEGEYSTTEQLSREINFLKSELS